MTREEFRDYVESLHSQNEIFYDVYSGLIDGIDTLELDSLELESCEDDVSRNELIKRLGYVRQLYYKISGNCSYKELPKFLRIRVDEVDDLIVFIKEMPPAQPKLTKCEGAPSIQSKTGCWISVSKRLPTTSGVYRVTRCYPTNTLNRSYIVDACYFDGSDTWHNDNRINHERTYADNVWWKYNKSEDKEWSIERNL